ncbi:hypothetical protein NEF87_002635 [Candidatus Lokiarchaeum ossiferum]|uniref:ArnR1-like winged helix-turn-helix domain-containing protein n=1 Tax=Candidatus Lokiarchaeum ossiferum TaxID=2951803 RepID=A0ABY6HS63_9ARCH|nr:hypothetical protein NEF87_002635 [Candidatus Lokiarchaeum sp. B-35]
MSHPSRKSSFYLTKLFGSSVNIKILEILLRNALEEQIEGKTLWRNFSNIASQAKVAKSSGKRILDQLLQNDFVEEKIIETHAQSPPRMVRLNSEHPAVVELIFFFKKVRGFL